MVKSISSKLIIRKDNWDDALKDLKREFSDNQEVQSATSIYKIARIFNWRTLVDYNEQIINGFRYYHPEEYPSESYRVMLSLSRYIEPGGYIQMFDPARAFPAWVYKFNGSYLKKENLDIVFVDKNDINNLKDGLNTIGSCLIKKGVSREEINSIINKLILDEYLS